MILRIRNWVQDNQGLLVLAGVIITAIGVFGPWVAKTMAPFLNITPKIILFTQRYNEIAIGIALIGLFLIQLILSNKRRISILGERLEILETRPTLLLDESTSLNLSNWSYKGRWSLDGENLGVTDSSVCVVKGKVKKLLC